MMEGWISVETAMQTNDKIVGIMLLCMVALALAAWVYVGLAVRKERKARKKAIRKAVEKALAEAEEKGKDAQAKLFLRWQTTRSELNSTRDELTATKDALVALKGDYDRLCAVADGCPAAGTRGKL